MSDEKLKSKIKKSKIDCVYLLTITDTCKGNIYTSVYSDRILAMHYMLMDIINCFEEGKIKNIDNLKYSDDVYNNGYMEWEIVKRPLITGII